MGEFADWDLTSREFLYTTLVLRYGWVLALAVVVQFLSRPGIAFVRPAGSGGWQHLPVLCWGLVTGWRHLDFWYSMTAFHAMPELYLIVVYESLLGLCAVCAVQVAGLTLAGRPAWNLGTTGRHRAAMIVALLTVTLDVFFYLHAIGILRQWRL